MNFDSFYQIEGPIRQFQGVMLTKRTDAEDPGDANGSDERKVNKEGMRELLKAVSEVAGTKWAMVEARFEWSWDEFESSISDVIRHAGEQPVAPSVSAESLLQEILDRMSALERSSANASRLEAERLFDLTFAEVAERERHMANSAARARVQGVQNILEQYKVPFEDFFFTEENDGTTRAIIRLGADGQTQFVSRAVRALGELGITAEIVPRDSKGLPTS
ncbi:hypothetical protein [Rhodococcus phenolicus]|uniref:hypothetical protein n=1 Tax=Rhodococcus phenolicus TaxID=263849 RepID=UPI0008347E29|nr:hypothetical protein [Rhodococcus phenolicus]